MELITEEQLNEILDTVLHPIRDHGNEQKLNREHGHKIDTRHTSFSQTETMKKHGIAVIKMKANAENGGHVEYHIHNNKSPPGRHRNVKHVDNEAARHAISIISGSAQHHLKHGHIIKLHTNDEDQHKLYQRVAKHIVNRIAKNGGAIHKVSGIKDKSIEGLACHTTVVEDSHDLFGASLIESIRVVLSRQL